MSERKVVEKDSAIGESEVSPESLRVVKSLGIENEWNRRVFVGTTPDVSVQVNSTEFYVESFDVDSPPKSIPKPTSFACSSPPAKMIERKGTNKPAHINSDIRSSRKRPASRPATPLRPRPALRTRPQPICDTRSTKHGSVIVEPSSDESKFKRTRLSLKIPANSSQGTRFAKKVKNAYELQRGPVILDLKIFYRKPSDDGKQLIRYKKVNKALCVNDSSLLFKLYFRSLHDHGRYGTDTTHMVW